MQKAEVEAMELSFKILETVLILKEYSSKEEVMKVIETMRKVALDSQEYPKTVKDAYIEAYKKLNSISFDDMMEIKSIITED